MNLIAHRGNNNINYPNSINAIISSLNYSYISGVEFDIRLTKDKKIIVTHDPFIRSYNYKYYFIKNNNLKKLKKINFGSMDNPNYLSSLEEVLNSIDNNKIILIDIKESGKDYKIFVDILCKTLTNYSYLNIYLCSFNYKLIKLLKTKYKKLKCGLIIGYLINDDKLYNHFDFNIVHYDYLKRINIKKETFIWTINDKKIASKVLEYNNKFYIISDKSYILKNQD